MKRLSQTVFSFPKRALAQTVAPARLWHWLHWPQDDALAALS